MDEATVLMASQPVTTYLTPEEYLALERQAEYKSEYLDGEIYAMTGATRKHNIISLNIGALLNTQLRNRPCEAYASDMRVRISSIAYTYPDVVVVCGEVQIDDSHNDTLLNPTLIVEVLSPSTEGYDRGLKFEHYPKVESLMEYVLVAQDKYHVEHFVRQPDNQWLLSETDNRQDSIQLPSIHCELAVADIYNKVDFDWKTDALR